MMRFLYGFNLEQSENLTISLEKKKKMKLEKTHFEKIYF